MTGAEKIVEILADEGVPFVTGIPGGAVLPLYDALSKGSIPHVLARHEQGAGFIAQGYARATGKTGVCIASSGPGATNLITALADAYLDSVPMVAITGQVPRDMIGTDAFQEVDTVSIARPVTKGAFLISDPSQVEETMRQAFALAREGRPGPVLVDIPKDVQALSVPVQRSPISVTADASHSRAGQNIVDQAAVSATLAEIANSRRPILYVGGGVISSNTSDWLLAMAEKSEIPVVSTLMGLGAFPSRHPLFLGMLGMHAAPYTNLILEEADLLIALGVRFDDRAVGKASEFCPNARVVHADIDPSEFGKIRTPHVSIHGDLAHILPAMTSQMERTARPEWMAHINAVRDEHPLSFAENSAHPIPFIRAIGERLGPEVIVTTDVGQHQMWAAQAFPFQKPRSCITSGGLGTMGFGLPAAIGAALGRPDSTIVCISGDGSILMNIQELALLADLDLNVKLIVMNNGHLGLVRQQQSLFFQERLHASALGKRTDLSAVARGFGLRAHRLEAPDAGAVMQAIERPGPVLVDVPIAEGEMVFPMVPPGAPNHRMLRHEDFMVAAAAARA